MDRMTKGEARAARPAFGRSACLGVAIDESRIRGRGAALAKGRQCSVCHLIPTILP
jgi:hypothetical protein